MCRSWLVVSRQKTARIMRLFDKNVDRKSPAFAPPQSHPVTMAHKPLFFIDFVLMPRMEIEPYGTNYRRF